MSLPTWNGEPVNPDDLLSVQREAFDTLAAAMGGRSVNSLSQPELLHLIEAASHLQPMIAWVEATAFPTAREAGASWATLASAMGVSRSTAQYRYKKNISDALAD